MEEDGKELESDRIGIFLPFHHVESRMKKYMEMANGIGLACRGNNVDMLRDRASITPAPQKPFIYLFQLEEMRRSWSSDGTLIEQKLYFVPLYCSSFFFAKACRIQLRTAPHLLDKHDTILVLQNGVLFNI